MKAGFIVAGLLIAVLVIGGGFFFLNSKNYGSSTSPESSDEQQLSTGTPETSGEENQSAETTQNPKTYSVEIKNLLFNPKQQTINVGDTVVWTNKDSVSHTVDSDSGNEIKSGMLSGAGGGGYYSSPTAGETYSHTFTKAGTYNYYCAFHPGMTGVIIVQ